MNEETASIEEKQNPYILAFGLLKSNWLWILCAYPILALPYLLSTKLSFLTIEIFSTILELSFVWLTLAFWTKKIFSKELKVFSKETLGYVLAGICLNIISSTASQLIAYAGDFNALIISSLALLVCLRYFFYFFPMSLTSDLKVVKVFFDRIYSMDRYVVVKILFSAYVVQSLLWTLTSTISPDGRLVITTYIELFLSQVGFILSFYLSLAFCIYLVDEATCAALNITKNKTAMNDIMLTGDSKSLAILSPKNAAKIMLVVILLMLANFSRLISTVPPVKFENLQSEMQDHKIIVSAKLNDSEGKLRGFIPHSLALAGESREEGISESIDSISIDGSDYLDKLKLPEKDSVQLKITFKAKRSLEELKALEKINLWYNNAKITELPK